MPWGLKRFQQACCLHFITFSCHHRDPLVANAPARDIFEHTLERVRQWYGFCISGYVIMPEHKELDPAVPTIGSKMTGGLPTVSLSRLIFTSAATSGAMLEPPSKPALNNRSA